MKVFEVKGVRGVLKLTVGIIASLFVFVVLPALFLLILFNALIFEGLGGPEISFTQAFLMWCILLVGFKLIFNPTIVFEFKRISDPKDIDKHLR